MRRRENAQPIDQRDFDDLLCPSQGAREASAIFDSPGSPCFLYRLSALPPRLLHEAGLDEGKLNFGDTMLFHQPEDLPIR